jgi:hypothetical protein
MASRTALAPCGTPAAYKRHVRNREPIDTPCRIANTEADRRLRETGTTLPAPPRDDDPVPRVVLDGDERAAALTVVNRACDTADARHLLETLGLLPARDGV